MTCNQRLKKIQYKSKCRCEKNIPNILSAERRKETEKSFNLLMNWLAWCEVSFFEF